MDVFSLVVILLLAASAAASAVWFGRARRGESEIGGALDAASAALGRRPASLSSGVARLIEQRDAAVQRAAFVESAVDQSSAGVLVLGADLEILFATATARRLLEGRHGDAAAGARIRSLAREVLVDGEPVDARFDVYQPGPRVLRVRADPLPPEVALGVIVNVADVTEQDRVDAVRQDFVANVSHELKTPVGALSLLAEAISDTDDDVAKKRLAERLVGEARRVAALVDDILDLSLVERDAPGMSRVDLVEVVIEACRRVEVVAEPVGVVVTADLGDEAVVVTGDRVQLVSAVANLLDNAIKYGSSGTYGGDEVHVRLRRRDGAAVIEVEDSGIGIPERHQSRIFERFYRVDGARSRASGGTGLGLAIVRHVARNHGGDVELESAPGSGSTFRVVLPAVF